MANSGTIVIGGERYDIGWAKTVNFLDSPSWNAHTPACVDPSNPCPGGGVFAFAPSAGGGQKAERFRMRRVSGLRTENTPEGRRPFAPLSVAQAYINQFVIHHDGCADARMCFNVLHNERGLSCHFLLDNDGTLVQTLDLLAVGFHATWCNERSVGMEMCNRGDAKKEPTYYSKRGQKRDVVACSINGHKFIAYDFTPEQYTAMDALGVALAKLLPGIKLDSPQAPGGGPLWDTLPGATPQEQEQKAMRFPGYIAHYHITKQKWDPGPFDFGQFIGRIRGRRTWPVKIEGLARREISPEPAELEAATSVIYQNNEQGEGGFFPVGPLEGYRLWHNGIHLHTEAGAAVVAPVSGYVLAARNGPDNESIGSTSFVLAKHELKVGEVSLVFHTVFFHLAEEQGGKSADVPKWMGGEAWGDSQAEPGALVTLEPPEMVQAGDLLGHVGVAGPDDNRTPQLHFEIFTTDRTAIDKIEEAAGEKFWTTIDGSTDRRFCTQAKVLADMEKGKKDGLLTREELFDFFRQSPKAADTRKMVTFHISEWTDRPEWLGDLESAGEYKKLKKADLQKLVEEQINPTLWWTETLADRCGLPRDGMIYTFHPVSFLAWLEQRLAVTAKAGSSVKAATAEDWATVTEATGVTDDGDKAGDVFMRDEVTPVGPNPKPLELEDIVKGYSDEAARPKDKDG